jgi:hypothetical protein
MAASITGAAPLEAWWARWWWGIPVRGWLALVATLVPALVIMQGFPLLDWIMRTLGTLCHEMGHAAAALLVGRPALPAFDLTHGGA